MMMPARKVPTFRVRMRKSQHVFSAGHFITLSDNLCEPVHGHNWTVACEIEGPLDSHGMVIDFILLKDTLTSVLSKLDHKMLLPTQSRLLRVVAENTEVTVLFGARRWIFPADECVLLPISNTTAELLAMWIGQTLGEHLASAGVSLFGLLRIEVDECLGQSAVCEFRNE